MKRIAIIIAAILTLGSQAWAEFTTAEKTQLANLAQATISSRAAARAMEGTIPTHLTLETRPLYYAAEHTIGETNEESSLALHYLLGAIAERGSAAKKALETAPRSTFLTKAFNALDEALEEAEEAEEALDALAALFPGDIPYHNAIASAQYALSQAEYKLVGFNRTLAYADPTPTGAETLAFRDTQTAIYRWVTQYGYDSAEVLFESGLNTTEDPLSSTEAGFMASALTITWIIADDGIKTAERSIGIQLVAGEDGRLAALNQMLLAGTGGTTTRFQFAITNMANLLVSAGDARPILRNGTVSAINNNVDSWKRMDNVARAFAQ